MNSECVPLSLVFFAVSLDLKCPWKKMAENKKGCNIMGFESRRNLPTEHAILYSGKCSYWMCLEKWKCVMQNVLMCSTLCDITSVIALKIIIFGWMQRIIFQGESGAVLCEWTVIPYIWLFPLNLLNINFHHQGR